MSISDMKTVSKNKKKGSINPEEKQKEREVALLLSAKQKKTEKGKVLVKVDEKTFILVDKKADKKKTVELFKERLEKSREKLIY